MIVSTPSLRLVLATAGSREQAASIAAALVEGFWAACVNVVPAVTSVYRWQGKVETADEFLLIIKTTAEKLEGLEAALRTLHSYEVPEFLVLAPEAGAGSYADWLARAVQP